MGKVFYFLTQRMTWPQKKTKNTSKHFFLSDTLLGHGESARNMAAFVSKAGFAPLVRGVHRRRDVSVVRRHRAASSCVSTVRVGATGESEAPTTEAAQVEEYVETEEELRERRAVGELVAWCVSRGAAGSGLSVLLPDGTGRGRGLEASRALAVRAYARAHAREIFKK